jgi:hypothetical protein
MKKFLLILALAAVCFPFLMSEAHASPVKHHSTHGHAHHHGHHHHHAGAKKA